MLYTIYELLPSSCRKSKRPKRVVVATDITRRKSRVFIRNRPGRQFELVQNEEVHHGAQQPEDQ